MLIFMLTVLSIVLAVALVFMTIRYAQQSHLAREFARLYNKSNRDYIALSDGRDEESEAYEQMYLSNTETIEYLNTTVTSYVQDLHFLMWVIDALGNPTGKIFTDEARERLAKIKSEMLIEDDLEG